MAKKNPLTEVLPPKARKVLYAVLFVLALAYAAYQASEGDLLEAIGGLITALFNATAASNVTVRGEVVEVDASR